MSSSISVMLVDDHALVRETLARTLSEAGMRVVAECATGEDALTRVLQERPDVVLIDIGLPGMGGMELVRELRPRLPQAQLIMLTGSTRREDVLQALRNGATGYLVKDISSAGLIRAIQGSIDGDLAMPRRLATALAREVARRPSPPSTDPTALAELTGREMDVLRLLTEGLTDREIGQALAISPRTVGHHVGSILAKLGVRSRREAARRWEGRA